MESRPDSVNGRRCVAWLFDARRFQKHLARYWLLRWAKDLPLATHEGPVRIGDAVIPAANLSDGRRVLSQGQFLRAIGRSAQPKAGTGVLATVDQLPFFLQAEALKPFISKELEASTKPIFYLDKSGNRAIGYDALFCIGGPAAAANR